ncbi:hypothetical protein [Deinococcus sp. QL22]|uniref:DinB/UmuC family translesion DNA polymerase n=1 Tax=Deinococcus sp. QL22 TaxID=2939437 RepID=UPI0035300946
MPPPSLLSTVSIALVMPDHSSLRKYGTRNPLQPEFGRVFKPYAVGQWSAKKRLDQKKFNPDLRGIQHMHNQLQIIAARLQHRLEAQGLAGRTVVLKVKFASFDSVSRQISLSPPVSLESVSVPNRDASPHAGAVARASSAVAGHHGRPLARSGRSRRLTHFV